MQHLTEINPEHGMLPTQLAPLLLDPQSQSLLSSRSASATASPCHLGNAPHCYNTTEAPYHCEQDKMALWARGSPLAVGWLPLSKTDPFLSLFSLKNLVVFPSRHHNRSCVCWNRKQHSSWGRKIKRPRWIYEAFILPALLRISSKVVCHEDRLPSSSNMLLSQSGGCQNRNCTGK